MDPRTHSPADPSTLEALHPTRRRRRHTRRNSRTASKTASTRDQILGAAFRTLVKAGYNQVSMRVIAEEAGVNQSLLHYYFGSKENLMLEVLQYVNDQLLARQRKMYAEAGSFEAIWATALEYFKEDVRSGYVRALWELWAQGLSNPRIKKRWGEMIQQWRDLVTGLARDAIAESGLQGAFKPEILGRVLGDLYIGAEVEILSHAEADFGVHFEAIRLMGDLFRWLALDKKHRSDREAAVGDL